MATQTNASNSQTALVPQKGAREWNEFAYAAFARIVARKHDVTIPVVDLRDLSDEELVRRLRLVSELAHLPPA